MARPSRSKRVIDYSQFGDFDDEDEDFACSSAPPSKKSRINIKEVQQKKETIITKPDSQETNKKPVEQRLPLDEKLYRRNLETAIVLSMQTSAGKVNEAFSDKAGESINVSALPSNYNVECIMLGLGKIANESEVPSVGCRQREAASKAVSKQRQIFLDDESSESEKDCDYSPSSENNENANSGDEDEDDQFTFKNQLNRNKKRNETKIQTKRKEKSSTPKNSAIVAPVAPNPVRSKMQILPSLSETTPDSPPSSKTLSPSIGVRKLKWTPPASKESRTNMSATVSVKSPSQGLRLGLSRLARVKPLHPN